MAKANDMDMAAARARRRRRTKRDSARRFEALKADLGNARREVGAGAFDGFDPRACEPDACRR